MKSLAGVPALMLLIVLAGLLPIRSDGRQQNKVRLSLWGLQFTEDWKGVDEAIAEFERRHPNIEVSVLTMGAGDATSQKLLTSIVGKTPPDVIFQGRHTIGDFASRDVFMPLDDLIERDRNKPLGIKIEDFYPACVAEATYKGKIYGIPINTDDRALYYNRSIFREVGLDPDRPPRTWDELTEYAKKLSLYREDGRFKRTGFSPTVGNCHLYFFSWQNGGEFMSKDGRTCTMNNSRSVSALQYMVDCCDALGGIAKINAFASGFSTDELDPFLTGKLAMRIDGNWYLNRIARYAPNLDFAVAPAPVPRDRYEGKPPFEGQSRFITWSGGFSLVIPKGARHVEESWELIKWMVSEEAMKITNQSHTDYSRREGRESVPFMTANSKVNDMLRREFAPKNEKIRESMNMFFDLMTVSRYRPVTFVGQRIWMEHVRATDLAARHKLTPQAALDDAARIVQKDLDRAYTRERLPVLNWVYPAIIIGAGIVFLAVIIVRAYREHGPKGRLAKRENLAGFLFASPWILGFLVLTAGPIIASIIFSFCDYDIIHPARWIGAGNYLDLFGEEWHVVRKCLYNVGFLALFGLPLSMAAGLGIALLLNTKVQGMTWYRTAYYLPAIVPVVANAILWIWLLNPEFGLMNAAWRMTFSQWFGWSPPMWLQSEVWSKPALILIGVWGAGGGMILWLAGLQGVPQHLYEAAEIDGANWWSRFRHVTLPMLTPYLFFNLIMGIIGILQTFELVYVMTSGPYTAPGGPVDSTLVPVVYLFVNGFHYFKMGFASALAWLLFSIILVLTIVQLKLAPRWVYYEGDRAK